jgi:hypothetical protein
VVALLCSLLSHSLTLFVGRVSSDFRGECLCLLSQPFDQEWMMHVDYYSNQ